MSRTRSESPYGYGPSMRQGRSLVITILRVSQLAMAPAWTSARDTLRETESAGKRRSRPNTMILVCQLAFEQDRAVIVRDHDV